MAEQNGAEKNDLGPHLAAAFFCEQSIEDKQGALSIVRMTDQIDLFVNNPADPDFPNERNRLHVSVHALITFKTGSAPGRHEVSCIMESPSGKKQESFRQVVQFPAEPFGGANLRLTVNVAVYKGGVFWLHVYLDGKYVTRMPINILIHRNTRPPNDRFET